MVDMPPAPLGLKDIETVKLKGAPLLSLTDITSSTSRFIDK